jgi:hypothetical protein
MDCQNSKAEQDKTSYIVSRPASDIDGFCHDYTLRRHKYEQNANEGSFRCRDDWRKYIGPIERWGSCNPFNGHFASVVLPLCKPERLGLVSYVFECKWLCRAVKCASFGKMKLTHGNYLSQMPSCTTM